MTESAETLQARYYEQSASAYDSVHNASDDHEHNLALQYILMISHAFGLRTFLDVGAGTGRGICFLLDRGMEARGIEPVAAMIERAELNGVPKGLLIQGSGYELRMNPLTPFLNVEFSTMWRNPTGLWRR